MRKLFLIPNYSFRLNWETIFFREKKILCQNATKGQFISLVKLVTDYFMSKYVNTKFVIHLGSLYFGPLADSVFYQ